MNENKPIQPITEVDENSTPAASTEFFNDLGNVKNDCALPCAIPQTAVDRFWSKVDKAGPVAKHVPGIGPCWVWIGGIKKGYGSFYIGRVSHAAHRVSWQLANGGRPDPALQVMHACDNPACVNPAHLSLGTNHQNVLDSVRKGRCVRARGERSGRAKLSDRQVADLRSMAARGVRHATLAADFGISVAHVGALASGRSRIHASNTNSGELAQAGAE